MSKAIFSLMVMGAAIPLGAAEFLEPLVVTASRSGAAEADAAYTVETISAEFIERNTRRTLPEALQFTPGVMVQKTAHGHGSPFIRGFTGRQNLLLVDGVRFNNSALRGGPVQYWNTVDPFSLERIELIKSQGSVLYGSDAVGGTLNAFTKSSDFRVAEEGRAFLDGSAFYQYRSNGDDSHIGRIESAFGLGGKFGVLLGVTAKDFGDIRDSGVGLMRNTGYPEEDLDLRLDMALGDDATLTLLHQYVNQDDIWRWHSTVFNPGWRHDDNVTAPGRFRSRIYDQERSLTYLRAAGGGEVPWLTSWSATVSYQTGRDRESQDRSTASSVDRRYQVVEVDTLGFDLALESPLSGGKLVYGLDYYRDQVDTEAFRDRGAGSGFDPSFRPLADDSEYDLFGAYAQYSREVLPGLELTGGGRFTYARAELGTFFDTMTGLDTFGASRSWEDFTGSLRALYKLDDCWGIYGGVSQAFRSPNLDDLSGNLTSRSGTTALGSVGVEPEEYTTYELGVRRTGTTSYFNAAVFYTDAEGLIIGTPTTAAGATTVATNSQDAYVYGVELEGAWEFSPGWTVSGFAAWQDGRTETRSFVGGPTVDEPVSRLMPLTGSLALRWTSPTERFWVEGRLLAAAEQDRLSRGDKTDTQRIPTGGTPGYTAWMLHGGWRASEAVELTLGLENLLNEDYRIHGSGQNEPGFNAIAGVKLSW